MELSGKTTEGEPIVVRLAPCVSATTRFIDSTGRPVPKLAVLLDLLVRPGAELQESIDKQVQACISVPLGRLMGSSCIAEGAQPGTLTFSCLIPGATYVVKANEGNGYVRKATFKVQARERLVLPDITLKLSSGKDR